MFWCDRRVRYYFYMQIYFSIQHLGWMSLFMTLLNPNKAGLFKGSFFWGEEVQFDPPPFLLQEELI